jgi:FKBP-type peptidyl-prolyl cis-trans isomerase FklB
MKTFYEYKSVLAGIGYTLLITSLAGCDRGADPDITASNAGVSPGYDAGYDFGVKLALLRQQQPDIELDDAFKGILDALSDTNQLTSRTELCARLQPGELEPAEVEFEPAENIQRPQTEVRSHNIVDFTKDDYVVLNSSREGVVTLSGGAQYEEIQAGSGERPQAGDAVLISYQASLDNGTVIDSSDDGGLLLSLDNIVAPGLKESLLLMNAGARSQVIIPPNIGYSSPGSRMFRGRENRIIRRRDLIYDIELISIKSSQPADASD